MSTSRAERSRWLRVLLIVVALVLLVPLLMMLFMMPMMGMMGWWFGGASGTGMGISPVWGIGMMLVFLVVLLGIGYLLYRAFTQGLFSGGDPALEELRLAYARGELSQEEFEQRREDLQRTK
ncbi:SHOCT domain-containing protein [Haladaptatus halobius]|uniref:SHOCT domain-containing protein n=1 Tax=Haladaptatus halobius TaxID=2884875 RepID=UPI001D0A66B9|nr:SHOCT domain-containing protein [Haladaptatus halobius]